MKSTTSQWLRDLKRLPKSERDQILVTIVGDRALRKDLLDLAIVAQRRREPSRSLRDYLAERKR